MFVGENLATYIHQFVNVNQFETDEKKTISISNVFCFCGLRIKLFRKILNWHRHTSTL